MYKITLTWKDGHNQFLRKGVISICEGKHVLCKINLQEFNWSEAQKQHSRVSWIARGNILETLKSYIFDTGSDEIYINENVGNFIYSKRPYVIVESVDCSKNCEQIEVLQEGFEWLVNNFIDKSSVLWIPNWQSIGNGMGLDMNNTILFFYTFKIFTYDDDMIFRYMDNKIDLGAGTV